MSAENAARAVPPAADPADPSDTASLLADLRAYLAEVSDGKLAAEAIDPASHLFDFGYVDSLSAVMFTAHLEDRYGVRLEETDLLERLTTLEQVVAHVRASRR